MDTWFGWIFKRNTHILAWREHRKWKKSLHEFTPSWLCLLTVHWWTRTQKLHETSGSLLVSWRKPDLLHSCWKPGRTNSVCRCQSKISTRCRCCIVSTATERVHPGTLPSFPTDVFLAPPQTPGDCRRDCCSNLLWVLLVFRKRLAISRLILCTSHYYTLRSEVT